MSARPTKTGLLGMVATCYGCGFLQEGSNALGLAARHHDATGHEVHTEITRVVIYGDHDAALRAAGQTSFE